MPFQGSHVGPVVGAEADRALLPAPVAQPAGDEAVREKVPDRTGASRKETRIERVIEDLNPILVAGEILPHRQRRRQVRPGRPLRGVAAPPSSGQEAGPQPSFRSGGSVDGRLVQRVGALPAPRHYPLSEGCVTMSRTSSLRRCGKPHVRVERGMGKPDRPAAPAPLTTNGPTVLR